MKLRDSGMPEEAYWETLLRPEEAFSRLGVDHVDGDAAEFGCGYGTFTLPLAQRVTGVLHAFDIDPGMVDRVDQRSAAKPAANVRPVVRDLFADGTGLADGVLGLVTIFNLLHCEEPAVLLAEAHRILRPGGLLLVMHWIHDPSTPRGPALEIRPRPEVLRDWCTEAGFSVSTPGPVGLPPYHYGWRLVR